MLKWSIFILILGLITILIRYSIISFVTYEETHTINQNNIKMAVKKDNKINTSKYEKIISKIKSSIKSKNIASLSANMIEKVDLKRYGTRCCGKIAKEKINSYIDISNADVDWDFDQNSEISNNLRNKSFLNLENSIIGISQNNMVFACSVNKNQEIISIFMADDYNKIED